MEKNLCITLVIYQESSATVTEITSVVCGYVHVVIHLILVVIFFF